MKKIIDLSNDIEEVSTTLPGMNSDMFKGLKSKPFKLKVNFDPVNPILDMFKDAKPGKKLRINVPYDETRELRIVAKVTSCRKMKIKV